MPSIAEAIDRAARSFTGQLVQPADAGYDGWRRVHNGLIDKHPAAIARCHGVADVVNAVALARTLGLDVAVRGGGHNVAGHATLDDGLLIDLAPMKGIHVDMRTRTARAQGGIVEHFHGAASRVPVERTACTLRTTGFNVLIVSQWTSADETERGIAWARDTFSVLTPYLAPTRYLNYLEDDAVDPAAVAYGPNLRRLRELKTKWDPDNFLRRNVNILPRAGDAI